MKRGATWAAAGICAVVMAAATPATGNGGPFIVKYPKGDPAAKGVLARLDPSLLPAREKRLEVVKEDLNSIIYGVIRQRARKSLEKGIAADRALARLVKAVGAAMKSKAQQRLGRRAKAQTKWQATAPGKAFCAAAVAARKALEAHLKGKLGWAARDAALLVEYASVDLGRTSYPADGTHYWPGDAKLSKLQYSNMGPLAAIGEQRSTQMLALLAGRFDKKVVAAYQTIFKAWGGNVGERSVDLGTGKLRPREIAGKGRRAPTVYARVAYFNGRANITPAGRHACKRVLKNLPVVFTFAPMNLLYYQVTFPAGATRKVAVSYQQFAYEDTRGRTSYQLAYVMHPASLWRRFGPISLNIYAPRSVSLRASVPCVRGKKVVKKLSRDAALYGYTHRRGEPALTACKVTLNQPAQKKGELFVGLDAAQWRQAWGKKKVGTLQGRGR